MNIKKLVILFLFIYAVVFKLNALEWKYDDKFQDKLLYLHAIVNYQYHPLWDFDWERDQFSRNGIRFSFGSVETHDLLCKTEIIMNEHLGGGFWFTLNQDWLAGQHISKEQRKLYLGIEKSIIKNLYVTLAFDPAFNKEKIDGEAGLMLADSDRKKYLRLTLNVPDFVYDEKNSSGGKTLNTPLMLKWRGRYGLGQLWFYAEGRYGNGFERTFNDPEKSPDIHYHAQNTNQFDLKLYYRFDAGTLLEGSFHGYHFFEDKEFYSAGNSYRFENDIYWSALKYIHPFSEKHRVRLIGRYVFHEAEAGGFKNFDFRRDEFLPAVFYEYLTGNSIWEFGYMGAFFEWESDSPDAMYQYARSDYTEKLKLAWTYGFKDKALIQLSLSHVLSYWGFGGGNIQFMLHL